MSTQTHRRIRQEVELIQRFAGSYGKKFDELIARMNQPPASALANSAIVPSPASGNSADGQSLRLCIEAVNMVLSLQGHLAGVLADLSRETREPVA